jgi:hypothetical protein
MGDDKVRVRFLLADSGTFHEEDVVIPAATLQGYDRLIDALQEDPGLLKELYLDFGRLSAAWLVSDED